MTIDHTPTTKETKPTPASLALIAILVLISCWGLFWLDHETRQLTDLFKPGNLVALVIYFTPTFAISYFLYRWLLKKYSAGKSIFLSLLTGVPLSFALIITCFLLLR